VWDNPSKAYLYERVDMTSMCFELDEKSGVMEMGGFIRGFPSNMRDTVRASRYNSWTWRPIKTTAAVSCFNVPTRMNELRMMQRVQMAHVTN